MRPVRARNFIKGTSSATAACLLALVCGAAVFGQYPAQPYPAQPYPPQPYPAQQQYPPAAVDPQQQPPAQQPLLRPEQLDDLVAPIALYPDPLLGQVLAASTYPLEVVEAQQWLQQNGNLRGADLMNAAKQQNWDPSVQALVAFPDVLTMLNRDVRWTTDLGNAFLAQQADVMGAVQRLRVRAQQNGRLSSNSQETVSTQTQNGQNAVVIEPANPQVIYVPVYNPEYVWGPPVWGYYPPLWYPPVTFGFGFGPGIFLSGFFPGWGFGWGGWGLGWGWGCGWFGGGLFVNTFFFNHWGFHGYYGGHFGGFGGREAWAHDPYHRAGIAYANRSVASRFNNSRFEAGRAQRGAFNGAARSFAGAGASRGFAGGAPAARGFANAGGAAGRGFGNSAPEARGFASNGGGWQHFGSGAPSTARGFAAPSGGGQGYRGSSSPSYGGAGRSYSAPQSRGGFSGGGGGGHSFGGGGGHSFGGGGGGGSHGGGGGHGGGHR